MNTLAKYRKDKNFLRDLKHMVINMVKQHGPIIDIVHNRTGEYDTVEKLINFLIDHFWLPNTAGEQLNKLKDRGFKPG